MILVTGGTGFVGGHVVRALRERDLPVRLLARRPQSEGARELEKLGCEIVGGDVTVTADLQAAVQGAEVIARPSALLRSADIAEMTSRARAYDNHVYVVAANSTGTDPAGVHYFGNSTW